MTVVGVVVLLEGVGWKAALRRKRTRLVYCLRPAAHRLTSIEDSDVYSQLQTAFMIRSKNATFVYQQSLWALRAQQNNQIACSTRLIAVYQLNMPSLLVLHQFHIILDDFPPDHARSRTIQSDSSRRAPISSVLPSAAEKIKAGRR